MEEKLEITTARQWKAFSHPLRLGILAELSRGERTNEELAKALGVESGKLYFHTKQLVTAGIIEPAGTRQKGPITEKLYRAVARRYHAHPPEMDGDRPPFGDMMAAALALYQSSWHTRPEGMDRVHGGYHLAVSLPPDRLREIISQFKQIVETAITENTDQAGSVPVALTILLHGLPVGIEGTPE